MGTYIVNKDSKGTYEMYGEIINLIHSNPSLINKVKASYPKICIDTIKEVFNQIEKRERLLSLSYESFHNSVSPNFEVMFKKIFNNELITNFNFNLETSRLNADEKHEVNKMLSSLALSKVYDIITN